MQPKLGPPELGPFPEFGANDILATYFGSAVIRKLNMDHLKLEPLKLGPMKLLAGADVITSPCAFSSVPFQLNIVQQRCHCLYLNKIYLIQPWWLSGIMNSKFK